MSAHDPAGLQTLLDRIARGEAAGLSEAEFDTLVTHVPSGFDGLSELDLLGQLPVIRFEAERARQPSADPTALLKRLKGLTRSYRRRFLGRDPEADRFEPESILPYVEDLEAIFGEAQAGGWEPDALLAKADGLTQKIVNTLAILRLLVRKERN